MAYPEALNINLCATDILVPRVISNGGKYWWVLLDESGDPAYRGVPLRPLAEELPVEMTIHGVEKKFEAVPLWDKKTRQALDETHPFEKTRRVHCHVKVGGLHLQVQSRLTVRKDSQWNFSFRAWQVEPPPVAADSGSGDLGGIHKVFGS